MDYNATKDAILAKVVAIKAQALKEQEAEAEKEECRELAKQLIPVTYRELRMFSHLSDPLSKRMVTEAHERLIKLQRMMNTGIFEVLYTPDDASGKN